MNKLLIVGIENQHYANQNYLADLAN